MPRALDAVPRAGRDGLPGAADALLAGLLAVVALLDLTVARLTPELSRSVPAALPFAVLVPAALAWRRRRPVVAGVAVAALVALQAAVVVPTTSLVQVLVLLAVVFSMGAHARLAAALPGTSACVLSIMGVAVASGSSAGGVLSVLPFVAVPFAAGVAVRAARGYARRLEQLTRELAGERQRTAHLAVVAERTRIARDLHDVVAHGVGVMTLQAGGARRILDQQPARAREALAAIEGSGRAALQELERMVRLLRDPGQEGEPDAASTSARLEDLAGLVTRLRAGGVDVEVDVADGAADLPLPAQIAVFRIVQEALTNAVKHAPGAPIRGSVSRTAASAEVEVVNTASAHPGPAASGGSVEGGGHGLVGMRERVALFDGTLEAGPLPAGGFRVTARVPLDGADG